MKTIGIFLAVAFASASAEARNPISDFCRAIVAEGPSGAMSVKYPQEALICAYQRDSGLEEFGNINDETCNGLAAKIKAEFLGTPVQFVADSAAAIVYARCVAAGSVSNNGGITIVAADPPTPPDRRPVVDREAMQARMGAVARAQADFYTAKTDALEASWEANEAIRELAQQYRSDEPDEPVRAPTVGEGIGITAGTGVIGAIGGSGISALAGGAVLTTGLLTGGISLAVGAAGVTLWWIFSDESAAIPGVATSTTASTAAASP